jgi:hypothetical protein
MAGAAFGGGDVSGGGLLEGGNSGFDLVNCCLEAVAEEAGVAVVDVDFAVGVDGDEGAVALPGEDPDVDGILVSIDEESCWHLCLLLGLDFETGRNCTPAGLRGDRVKSTYGLRYGDSSVANWANPEKDR